MKTSSYLQSLARDYLALVWATDSGIYAPEVVNNLNADRSVVHDKLLAAMGETRDSEIDMIAVCRSIVNL